jgi:hypothetical protein
VLTGGSVIGQRKTSVLFLILVVLLSFTVYRLLLLRSPVKSASAVETSADIGVYWDENCTRRVDSISWGAIAPGEAFEVIVYVRNEGNEKQILALTTLNWQPEDASLWLNFSWSCQDTNIGAGQVVKVTQILRVASDLSGGFSGFSFDTVFGGTDNFLGDINKDGVVDILDLAIPAAAHSSTVGDARWKPEADLNKDDVVDVLDIAIVAKDWGKNRNEGGT